MPLTDIDGQRLGDSVADKLGNRNLIINGAMQVAQRGSSANTSLTTYATVDRFRPHAANTDELVATQGQSTEAPAGYSNSFQINVTTAESALAADEFVSIRHYIEAQNLQHLGYGASGAEAVTLSFWVRSHVTGTYAVQLEAFDASRNITGTFSISAADTWEQKTITFDGDTAGSGITNDNGRGICVEIYLAAGTDYTSSDSTSWGTFSNARRAFGQAANAIGTTGSFYLTAVQLEIGNTATPFEHRSFAEELARCERYFEVIQGNGESFIGYSYSTTDGSTPIRYRTVKRDTPSTITLGTPGTGAGQIASLTSSGSYPSGIGTHNASVITAEGFRMRSTGYTGLTNDGVSPLYSNGNATFAKVDAEL